MLPLTATRLLPRPDELLDEPAGPLLPAVESWLQSVEPGGLVVLGTFGSGKSHLCAAVAEGAAEGRPPATVVPLRDVARHEDLEEGLRRVVGPARLAEARAGDRVLLLDGLDEIPATRGDHPAIFDALIALAGPRWLLTSRPGHFRTDLAEPDHCQVDAFRPGVQVLHIDPLPLSVARATIGALPGGDALLQSVEGLEQLSTSPLLLHVVHAALPHIEPGRPIQAWGVFDAWIRHALSTGHGHSDAVAALEELAWARFVDSGYGHEIPSFSPRQVASARLPAELRRALLVTDLDGRLRFGHRSVYEFLLAARMAPQIKANQDQGPDRLSGISITEAIRVFLVGRVGPMPVVYQAGRVRIPAGNYVAGGELSPDERPLRIEHIPRAFWLARAPVSNAGWARFLAAHPDDRVDANYLRHWGPARRVPEGQGEAPVHDLWPEDADAYAAWAGARLPTADEWEKAVRGLDGRRWPWGDHWRPEVSVTAELGLPRPLPVRAFGAQGEAGLFAAVGGVFEYTGSPWRGRPDRGRVVMGGCYTHPSRAARPSLRLSHRLSGHLKIGLRLAWDDP